MQGDALDRIRDMARGILEFEGMEYVHLEMKQMGGGAVLRLLIDKEGGVTLDDCSRISRSLSAQLDVDDLITHRYTLEVSSPGLDRPLCSDRDYQRFAGRRVRIRTVAPYQGSRQFVGRLVGLADGVVRIVPDRPDGNNVIALPKDRIAEAKLVPDFGRPQGRRGGRGHDA
jgi:ribosome maturation factor RimP